MRIYDDCLEMVKEVERDLFEMGTEYDSATVQDKRLEGVAARTLEMFGYSYCLKSDKKTEEMLDHMGANKEWVRLELTERLLGSVNGSDNPGCAWEKNERSKTFWEPFLRDGLFSYTYPERLRWQLPHLINELRRRPNSRQAMITVYSQERDVMNWGGRDRVPCSIAFQFLNRRGKLNLVYYQRSCDFLKFFASDVWMALRLQRHVASALKMEPGEFVHMLGSVHAFKTDLDKKGIF